MNCANHPAVAEGVFRCSRCGIPYCGDCLVTLQGRQYCARCKGEQLTDLRSGVDATQVQLAGIGRRFAALWIDGFIIGLPVLVVLIVFVFPSMFAGTNQQPPSWTGWIGYVSAPFYLLYEALMLKARGQTLGKMALGIKVVQPAGLPISAGQAWGRAAVRQLFFSGFSLIDVLPALFTKEKTCIHDMAAKTRVVIVR
jgi:uncharacterized RDD family membrane protein YckC